MMISLNSSGQYPTHSETLLFNLPTELVLHIFISYLNMRSVVEVSLACKTWKILSKPFFNEILKKRFPEIERNHPENFVEECKRFWQLRSCPLAIRLLSCQFCLSNQGNPFFRSIIQPNSCINESKTLIMGQNINNQGIVKIWNIKTYKRLASICLSATIYSFDTIDFRTIAVNYGCALAVVCLETQKILNEIAISNCLSALICVQEHIICGYVSGEIQVYRKDSLKKIAELRHLDAEILCLKAQNSVLFSVASDKTMKIWDLDNYLLIHSFDTHEEITCLALSDNKIVGGTKNGKICIWDMKGNLLRRFNHLEHEEKPLHSIVIFNRMIISMSKNDSRENTSFHIWDLETCIRLKIHRIEHAGRICHLNVSDDGKVICFSQNCFFIYELPDIYTK
ncbi:F-box/WD repeat-containing protein [Parachlamydia acanthamoebae]|uniref:F-box/WD repeat-containing protein n=2 Tax=Parachlamydia acanthamoebae TaxID=83552 RepID=UPI00126A62E2|nr:F-box/WD40 repeat-containing protein [Parachlamydia acanthamoebae]